MTLPLEKPQRIALFIDFYNGQLDIVTILEALRERGIIILKRAYGDWQKFSQFRRAMAENGVDLVERPSIYAGGDKNGADIQLAIEALDACLTNPHIDTFAIVSGDSDFLPLITRLQAYNKKVLVIGMRKTTSPAIVRNCNEYIAYENLQKAQKEVKARPARKAQVTPSAATAAAAATPTHVAVEVKDLDAGFSLLRRAVALLEDEDRTVNSSLLKQKMVQLDPAFDEKTYGFEQFRAFLAAAQKNKIIHIGKKEGGAYPIELGRKGRELGEEDEE